MKFQYFIIILLGFIKLSENKKNNNESEKNATNRILPMNFKPLNYFITLEPYLNNKTFRAESQVSFEIHTETKQITVHVDDLILNKKKIEVLKIKGYRYLNIKNIEIDDDQQLLTVTLPEMLQTDSTYYLIFREYNGKLQEDQTGFVYNEYQDEDGNLKNYAYTNLQFSGARRVFPCFDEPDLKAIFFVQIIRPGNYTSLSNLRLKNSTSLGSNNRYLDTFERTPEMSTHLFAVVVSDFICTEKNNSKIRICGRKSAIEKGRVKYALDIAPKTLKNLEEFTGINDFELPKLDIVAIPNAPDGFVAMENWGLITFAEKYLIYDNETNSKFELNQIAQLITHELSHQWFGNLVTLKWWKYLWLNEGFATYFQYYFFEKVDLESNEKEEMFWNITRFLQNDYEPFKTRALNYDVESTSEIKELFDAISYQKGACIIRMMESFLTKPVFKEGLHDYLLNKSLSVAEPSDLYYHLQRAALKKGLKFNVSTIMETWDSQSGFPLVTVTRNYENGIITLNQKDFISDDSNNIWHIPITYYTPSNSNSANTIPDFWLTTPEMTKNISELSYYEWILLNKNSTGYYRVNYDIRNWNLIADCLMFDNFEKIPVINRAQLVDDSISFANINKLPFSTTLNILNYLERETHYLPFIPFFENFDSLWKLVQNTDLSNDFQNQIQRILNEFYKKVTINESPQDSNSVRLLRPTLIYVLCKMGSITCRNDCHNQLEKWENKEINMTKTSREREILCGAVMYDERSKWSFKHIYKKFTETCDQEQKEMYLSALGCSENHTIINQFLDSNLIYNSKLFMNFFYKMIENSRIGVRIALDYYKNNSEKIASNNPKLFDLITESNLCENFNTEELLKEMMELKLFKKHNLEGFNSCIASIEANIKSSKEHLHSISCYYKNNYDFLENPVYE